MPLIGLAGPAGAGAATALGLMFLGSLLTFVIAFAAVALGWRGVGVASGVVHAAYTARFRPWEAFWPEPSDNWEVLELQAEDRIFAWVWVAVSVAVLTALVDAYQRTWQPRHRVGRS